MVDKLTRDENDGGVVRRDVDMGDGTFAERVVAVPPLDLLTDGGTGASRRLRVDVAQTGFFSGEEFRTFREFVAATGVLTIKAVVPIDIILFGLSVDLTDGDVKVETFQGGTESGTFAEVLPVFERNAMLSRPLPYKTPQVVLTAGGTRTGETRMDVLRAKTTGVGTSSVSVGSANADERGVAPGTYFFVLTFATASTGVFKATWEERN